MLFEKLKKRFPAIKKNEPLKNHCSLRVGGPAQFFYELKNIKDIPALINFASTNKIPCRIIGKGTNILCADKGFKGLIIKNLSGNIRIKNNKIVCDSGVILTQIVRLSVDNNLTGLEPLFGIPGTVGGAVFGNAGVPGCEIGNFVKTVSVFNKKRGFYELKSKDIRFGYRYSSLQKNPSLITQIQLELQKYPRDKSFIKTIGAIRRGKQPVGYSAGSFFKNPSYDKPAGLLIDKAGLKGICVGDAQISEKHGNFIINKGKATAKQILELANIAQQKIKQKFGINLEMEVRIIGDL